MRQHGGLLEVRLANVILDAGFTVRHPDISPGPHLELTVSDTGKGSTFKVYLPIIQKAEESEI